MPQAPAPFPDPGPDDAEPDGFPSVGEDGPDPEQGVYVTLPAEHLTLSGFCQGGEADTMAPGPLLATVVHTVTGDDGSGLAGGPGPGGPGPGPGPAPRPGPAAGPSLAALVTITIPLTTYQGRSGTPGEADGFGLVDGDDARDLAAAAARHPRTRWCVTALNPDGTAAAHGCLPGRHPPPGRASPTVTGGPALGPDPPPGTRPQDYLHSLGTDLAPVTRGSCDHARAEAGYRPSRKLRHLVRARSARCTAPGCGRPAARCDLDHTVPWDQGGITCECDLAPLCRHHHKCKQAQGWHLEQPEPGVLNWRTPSGRTYATTPTVYPI
jgi:hypothetical protein